MKLIKFFIMLAFDVYGKFRITVELLLAGVVLSSWLLSLFGNKLNNLCC
jgi:hypothetical protein